MKAIAIGFLAALPVLGSQNVFAQANEPPSTRTELMFSAGLARTDQFDATASPLRFGGQGFEAAAHFERNSARYVVSASLDGGPRYLSSAASVADITERTLGGEFRLELRRRIGSSSDGTGLSLGASLAAMLNVTAHQYDDPSNSIAHFVMGALTIGPSIAWRQSIAGGAARVQFSVPVAGVVDHPYSRARTVDGALSPRFATAASLHGLSADISYSPANNRRFGMEYGYHLSALRYADVQPVRSASQTVSVGAIIRFGGSRR